MSQHRRRLALDHLTAVDATPRQLAEAASAAGCAGVCMFLKSMQQLPSMPHFALTRAECRDLTACLADLDIALDLAYPFTLGGRSRLADFTGMLEAAAELGAGLVNVLLYDRDPERRLDLFGGFCDQAARFDLRVAVEFYPPSQVPSLAAALELAARIDRPGLVGVNTDILHLMRSGGTIAEVAAAPPGHILYAQVCDGPDTAPEDPAFEASCARLLAGEGTFDVAGFVAALPPHVPISVEIPRDRGLALPRALRVTEAIESVRAALANPF
ncbi:sugar phosphate isomerase/epimerase family protein [Novosphingobium lindaniclasticum]|nr:TIM barrel protein [Novosphingobium lindaniclasticum]